MTPRHILATFCAFLRTLELRLQQAARAEQ